MPKKAPGRKSGNDDDGAAGSGDSHIAAAGAEASGLRSPRAERQRVWARRADDTAAAMQQAQQLLQQQAADVDGTKQRLDQVTSTAKLLWALEVAELPPQYRDKSRPSSQRVGSGGEHSRSSSSSKQGQRVSSTAPYGVAAAATPATAASSGEVAAGTETVESAVHQITPAQRTKMSAALQALFYAPVVTAAATTAATPTTSPVASPTRPATTTSFTNLSTPLPTAADGGAAVPSETSKRVNSNSNSNSGIPVPLLAAMRDLQAQRIHLEAQLTAATAATAQQLQRFQLLQEEAMVAQYALEALRSKAGQPLTQS